MRFMMLMYPGPKAETGKLPEKTAIEAMMRYNEELRQAGVLLAMDGLQPTAKGARVSFRGGTPLVTDGPFPETKEVLGGFWMIQVKSKQEAVEWARRCPASPEEMIEIRQVYEAADFPEEVLSPEVREQEEKLRRDLERRTASR